MAAAPEASLAAKPQSIEETQLPEMTIANIAKFDNWDHRECAVENKQEWKDFMDKFLKDNPDVGAKIPKKIHQIWIGPKQPVSPQGVKIALLLRHDGCESNGSLTLPTTQPIVWIDTWRKKFRSQYPGWDYQLWTDAEVEKLPMRMQVWPMARLRPRFVAIRLNRRASE